MVTSLDRIGTGVDSADQNKQTIVAPHSADACLGFIFTKLLGMIQNQASVETRKQIPTSPNLIFPFRNFTTIIAGSAKVTDR